MLPGTRVSNRIVGMTTALVLLLPAAGMTASELAPRHQNAGQSDSRSVPDRPIDVPQTLGPFAFAGQTFSVLLHQRFLPTSPDPKFAQSLASLEIQDASGAILYQKSFPLVVKDGRFSNPVTAFAQPLVGIGDTWVVESRKIGTKWWLPSYTALLISYTGVSAESNSVSASGTNDRAWQVFGIKEGKLQLFDAATASEMLTGNSAPYAIVRGAGGITVVPMAPSSDSFNLRVWTGNFYVFVPLQVHWDTAKLSRGLQCFMSGRRDLGCDLRVDSQRIPSTVENSFLRLFPGDDPVDHGEPLHIVLDRNSQVQILKASAFVDWTESGDMLQVGLRDLWLKVRIDNSDQKEGWIHGSDDFSAAGWPSRGDSQ